MSRRSPLALLGSFATGINPVSPVFDGTSIWVANRGAGTVTKLRALDGLNQGTFRTGGLTPNQMVYDGDNIWVTDEFEITFVKLRPSDGAQVFSFRGGLDAPSGIAFDGTSVWVGERCGESRPPSRVDPSQPFGCDGSTLDPILKFDPAGKLLKSFGAGLLLFPHGIHIDREGNVWVADGLGRAELGTEPYQAILRPSGAGARHAVGTGVMGGMLAATFLAIFFIPLFFKLMTDGKPWEKRSTQELRAEIEQHKQQLAQRSAQDPS